MKYIFTFFLSFMVLVNLYGQLTGGSITIETGLIPRQVHRFNASASSPALGWPRTSSDTANDVLISIVGGGGGGGAGVASAPNSNGAGGGGGGEVKESSVLKWSYLDMSTSNTVIVGSGGIGGTTNGGIGATSSYAINNGTATTTYSANGGAGGVGANNSNSPFNVGGNNGNAARTGGSGANAGKVWAGGGGGGAAANGGAAASSTLGGAGGAGSQLSALASTLICGGGGGGGATGTAGAGGSGGGATGGTAGATVTAATANLGGGGGGATNSGNVTSNGGAGGSGVVVISYKKYDTYIATVSGNYNPSGWSGPSNVLTANAYKHVFAGAFNITLNADLNHTGELFVVESGTTLTIAATKTFTCKTLIVYGTLVNNGTLTCTNVFFAAVGGGQTIPAGSYTNLTLSNESGINTAGGAISVSGTLTTTSGGTLAMGAHTLTLSAPGTILTNTGTISTTVTSAWVTDSRSPGSGTYNGTITFAGTGQTIPANTTYTNLTIGNSTLTNTVGGAISVSGTLTTTFGGTFAMGANTLTLSEPGTTLTNAGTITTSAITAFTDSRTTNTFGGTVVYELLAGGQTIATGNYSTLTLSNTGGINTAGGAISVSGTLTTTSGGTLAMGAHTLTLSAAGTTLTNAGTITTSAIMAFTDSRTTNTFGGTVVYKLLAGGQTIATGNYSTLTLSNTGGINTAGGAISVSGTLTTTAGGTLAMVNNTLSVTTTLSNSGKISTTCPTATSATPLTLPVGTWGGTIEYASTSAQTVIGGTYTNLTLSGSGTKSTGSTINVGKVYTSESGKLQINSSGSLNITGTLSSNEIHSVGGSIELNGGDFIVSGKKNKDVSYSATAGTAPYMIIKSDIVDVLASGFRSNSIQFVPSNTSTDVSHIRFVGSGLDLGNSSSFNSTIKTNAAAYFEIGDGSTSTDLTLRDTLRLFNGLRTRSNSLLNTSDMLILNSSKSNILGGGVPVGYLDTCVASTISGKVQLIETFSARRKIRFLGNPFSANLSITDFTDDIDITGDRSGTNNNNFTATASNAPSAYTYNNSTDAWVPITNTTPTVLNSLQGMRILVRGVKGYGLDANNTSPVESRLIISGNAILGDQTINLLEGYNFITNPFLSIVDIGKVTKSTNVGDVIYMYSPSSSGYQTYNRNSGAISTGGAACWSTGTSIFFYASSTSQSIGVPEGAKLAPTKQSYNSHFGELDTLNNIGNVVLKNILERESLTDGITLDFSGARNATDDFDPLFDGVDFGSDSVNVSVVSSNGKFLSYQATNRLAGQEVRRYPLKVETRNSSLNGAYILMFDQFKAFTSDFSVLLVDKWLNTTTDLIAKPEYAFQISNDINSQGSGRFEIVVSNKSTVDVNDIIKGSASDFYVFKSPLGECVTFTAIGNGSNKSLQVLDLQGKLIKEYKDFRSPITLSSNEISRGIYIATVVSGQNKSTKKFIF